VGRYGEVVKFFGRVTRASPLPSLMARRSKSEVLAMSLITETPGTWRVCYHPVSRPFKTADCMEALEQAMRASQADVFWLQDRWRVSIRSDYTIRDWLGSEMLSADKPHRALLWLVDVPAEWRLPDAWQHPDVIYEIVLAPGQAKPTWLKGSETIHVVASSEDLAQMRKSLAAIDLAAALPIDYILTPSAPKVVAKAAAKESIQFVSLSLPPQHPTEESDL
jgi:hypothetical protein